MSELPALARLEADELIRVDGARHRTTRRWRGAMARAALRLIHAGDRGDDLRLPIASALLELYGADVPDGDLAGLVDAMVPIELGELDPPAADARPR